jgi:hypothetical protein
MIFLTFLAAFLLSGIAGYYSIIGLALIFPGAFWPVVIMGGSLEFSKLVTASWLYRNWKTAPILLKSYLTFAVLILMLITSMGIFGFLSKAHIEHSTESAPIADKIAMYDDKIASFKIQIDENKKAIKQMDDSVDQVLSRSTSENSALRSVQIRKSQQKERSRLTKENTVLLAQIAQVNEEKTPIMVELRKTEADIGPIKYVAELAYGSSDSGIVDKAVRMVIMIIMLVFDPLAVLLLVAGNISLEKKKEDKNERPMSTKNEDNSPTIQEMVQPNSNKMQVPIQDSTIEIQKENVISMQEPEHVETHHEEGIYSTEPTN